MQRVADGSTFFVDVEFFDEDGAPVVPQAGYPKLALLDADRTEIAQYSVSPGSAIGQWEASIALPELGVTQGVEYKLRWRCRSVDGDRYQTYTSIIVDPKADRRDSEVVFLQGDETAELVLPFRYSASSAASYQLFSGNDALTDVTPFDTSGFVMDAGVDRTSIQFPMPSDVEPRLQANLLVIRARVKGKPKVLNYKLWVITPQIALAASMIEDFLNKSRIENVIPELEYTYSDLLNYLERGLSTFNMTGITTSFNGLNMQGMLLDCWVICATYWALGAQLLAEGSLAFDFSGQGVSLNVDRTPQLDSALGRIEARIQDTVLPFKKQITSQGFFGGDGSQGKSSMRNPYSTGTLGLINAPTTRIGGLAGFTNFVGRRF